MSERRIDPTLWKFVVVGIANTVVGTGVMFLFYNVFGFGYWISSASNYVLGSIVSYVLNKFFTFKNNENVFKTLPRFVVNISVCYLLAYGCAKPLVSRCVKTLPQSVQENIAMIVGMCLFVGLNYLGQRFFVFKESDKGEKR